MACLQAKITADLRFDEGKISYLGSFTLANSSPTHGLEAPNRFPLAGAKCRSQLVVKIKGHLENVSLADKMAARKRLGDGSAGWEPRPHERAAPVGSRSAWTRVRRSCLASLLFLPDHFSLYVLASASKRGRCRERRTLDGPRSASRRGHLDRYRRQPVAVRRDWFCLNTSGHGLERSRLAQ